METSLYSSPVLNLESKFQKTFNTFDFEKNPILHGAGRIVKQFGMCRYGEVILLIEVKNLEGSFHSLSWEVSEEQIPFLYFDSISYTIKNIIKNLRGVSLRFRIIGGSFHEVDSTDFSYVLATYKAVANAISYPLLI